MICNGDVIDPVATSPGTPVFWRAQVVAGEHALSSAVLQFQKRFALKSTPVMTFRNEAPSPL